jgi:hypothetical protein
MEALDLTALTAAEIVERVHDGRLSAVEVAKPTWPALMNESPRWVCGGLPLTTRRRRSVVERQFE